MSSTWCSASPTSSASRPASGATRSSWRSCTTSARSRIPPEIINKPGPLDAEERAIINTHTIEGERMLAQVGGLLGDVGRIVRSCHERWDGVAIRTGLPVRRFPVPPASSAPATHTAR
jgi:hypothetical protein